MGGGLEPSSLQKFTPMLTPTDSTDCSTKPGKWANILNKHAYILSLESHKALGDPPPRTLVPGAICSCQELDNTESRHPLDWHGKNVSLCTELIDTKLYRPTCRDADASQ